MGNFSFTVPSLGNKFIDYRDPIPGDSYNWSFARSLSQPQYLAIHHSAGPDTQTPNEIALFHINTNRWGGIGYHFLVNKDGVVYYVGDLTTGRANVANLNHLVIGICLIGNFMGKIPPSKQLESTHELCAQLLFRTPQLPNINGWEDVVPHKQLTPTACPGDTWESWKPKIISGIPSQPQPAPSQARINEITQLYRVILGREPDQPGLSFWLNSNLTIDQIRKSLTESQEHQQMISKAKNFKTAQGLTGESLSLLSQAYSKLDQISKLSQ